MDTATWVCRFGSPVQLKCQPAEELVERALVGVGKSVQRGVVRFVKTEHEANDIQFIETRARQTDCTIDIAARIGVLGSSPAARNSRRPC